MPANAVKVGSYDWSATADEDGDLQASTAPVTVTKPGVYVYVETANAGSAGGSTWGKITGKFGDSDETVSLTSPTSPVVTTQIQAGTDVAKPISDTINGSGFPAGATVTGNDDLYFVPYGTQIVEGTVPANAEKITTYTWSATADADGKITATTPNYTPTKAGTYVFVESANAGNHGGYTWGNIKGKFGEHTESASLVKTITPKVSTKVSNATVKQGDALSDTVIGSGFPAGAAVTGSDDLYYLPKGVAVTTDGSIPKGAVKVGTFTWSGKADAKGNLSTTTAKYTVNKTDGTYVYVESANAGNHEGHVWSPVKGKFGEKSETSNVKTPKPPVVPTGDAEVFGIDTGALAVGGLITVVGASGLIGAFRLRRKATQEN